MRITMTRILLTPEEIRMIDILMPAPQIHVKSDGHVELIPAPLPSEVAEYLRLKADIAGATSGSVFVNAADDLDGSTDA